MLLQPQTVSPASSEYVPECFEVKYCNKNVLLAYWIFDSRTKVIDVNLCVLGWMDGCQKLHILLILNFSEYIPT